jgi:signal transduction histidine kinase
MFRLPNRAPIAHEEMRRPFNALRAGGALVFMVAAIIGSIHTDEPALLLIIAPSVAVVVDAGYRYRTAAAPFVGFLIDATALFVVLAVRGPTTTINAVVLMYLLVAASLVLPMAQAAIIVAYGVVWWIAIAFAAEAIDGGVIGVIERVGFDTGFDRVVIVVITVSVAFVMLGAINALLRAQDKQTEALAQERRALELKNEFVSMVSHELRTPLTGIAGFTETLNENWQLLPSVEVDEFLTIMTRETDHLANLVEDILVIPRLEAGQLRLDPEPLDLALETHAVASMLFSDNSDYSVTVPANVRVFADQTRLRQILRNLLENAQKYGGDQVLIDGELAGPGTYKLSVSDNGKGVAADDQERIFGHFEQLSTGDGRLEQGVGLGLPIARKLARAMGGDLWYEDRFPVGAKFCFTINLADDRSQEGSSASAEALLVRESDTGSLDTGYQDTSPTSTRR